MADEVFCNIFRITPDDLSPVDRSSSTTAKKAPTPLTQGFLDGCESLDRLTLLACNRQGVLPAELLDPDTNGDSSSSPSAPSSPYRQQHGRQDSDSSSPQHHPTSTSASSRSPLSSPTTPARRRGGRGGSSNTSSPMKRSANINNMSSVQDVVSFARDDSRRSHRMAMVAIVGKERRAICRALFARYLERLDREAKFQEQLRIPRRRRQIIPSILLNHEENKLHTELCAMESQKESLARAKRLRMLQEQVESDTQSTAADASSADGLDATVVAGLSNIKERDAVRSLLDVQSSTEAAERKFEEDMAQIALKGEKRIAKIRQKQINDIMRESEATRAREHMLQHLQDREDAWRQANAEKKYELHLKVLAEDKIREQKVEKHEREAFARVQAKKERLVSKITHHNKRITSIHEQREAERAERIAKLERQMEEGRARADAKKQEAREQAELLRAEVEMKLELHGSRKKNIDTRRHLIKASTERVHAQRLQQSLMIKSAQTTDPYFDELDEHSQQRVQAAAARKAAINSQRAAKFRANVEGHSRRREKGMEKQSMIEADRVDWCSALDHNWEVRKAHVDDVQQAQRDTAELLAEANAMRMEAHAANLDRIRRAEAYNQRVRKAVVQAQDEHIDMKKRADSDQRSLLKQSRVVIEKQQETMLVSLEQIRARGDGVPEDPDELRRLVEEQEAIQKGVVMSNISISRSHRNSSVSKPTTLAPLSTTTPPPPRASTTTEYYAGGADPSETTTTHNNTASTAPPPTMESLITKRIRRPASTMF